MKDLVADFKTMKMKINKSVIILISLILIIIPLIQSSEITNSYVKNSKYGTYTLNECSGLLCSMGSGIKTKTAEYKLLKMDSSIINVYAEGTVTLYQGNYKIFSGVEFYDLKGLNNNVRDSKILILNKEIIDVPEIEYTEQCNEIELSNNTIEKYNCKKIAGKETINKIEIESWKEYKGELLKAGTYTWKIEAKRPINKPIDFVLTEGITNTKLTEWAWWDSNYGKKQKINVTYLYGQGTTNYSLLINVTYSVNMMANFSDLRFTDSSETIELPYYIEKKANSGTALIYVKVPTLTGNTNTSIYMYYQNPTSTAGSNFNNAFVFGDDFNINSIANYNHNCDSASISGGLLNTSQGGSNLCFVTPNITYQRKTSNYTVEVLANSVSGYIGMFGHSNAIPTVQASEYYQTYCGGADHNCYINFKNWIMMSSTATATVVGAWVTNQIIVQPSNFSIFWNNTYRAETSNSSFKTGYYGISSYNGITSYDWLRVKSYIPILPTYTFNPEESSTQSPTIVLINPINNFNTNNTNVSFNCNATDEKGVMNLSLTIPYPNKNFTIFNASAGQNLSLNRSYIFAQGLYTWSCLAYDGDNLDGTTASRTFTVDYTPPVITFYSPSDHQEFLTKTLPKNITFFANATHHDGISLSVCYYYQFSTNSYVTCGSNYTYNLSKYSSIDNIIVFFANDTTGNFATETVTVHINNVNDSIIYSSSALTESSQSIYLYLNASNSTITTANLTYNGTVYAMTEVSNDGHKVVFIKNIIMPNVTTDTSINLYANYSINGNKLGTNIYTQDIFAYRPFNITDVPCVNGIVYNFTMYDEQNRTLIENGTIEFNFIYGTMANITKFNTFGYIYPNDKIITSLYVCANFTISPVWYIYSGELVYYRDDYARETYYVVRNKTVTNSTENVNLYSLILTSAKQFVITYKDASFIPRPDSLIYLIRKYTSLGTYNIVEILKTDSLGQAVGNFETSTIKYNLMVTDLYGNILSQYNDLSVKCQNVLTDECNILLNANSNSGSLKYGTSVNNMYYTLSFDRSTRTITMDYTNSDGISNIEINTTLSGFTNSTVCYDSEYAITGTLTCVIPSSYGNSSFIANIYKNGERVGTQGYSITIDPKGIYGTDGYFIAFLLILTFPLLLIGSPIMMIFGVVLGFILSILLVLINGGTWMTAGSVITWVIISGLILIWQLTKNRSSNM